MFRLVLYITFFVLVLSCSEEKNKPKVIYENTESGIIPDQVSYDVSVLFADSTFKKAFLTAQKARVYKKSKETILDGGVKVDFFSKTSQKKVSTLTSDSVKIDDKTKNMYAGGNVIVVSDSSQTTLTTNLLEWNDKTQKLFTSEYVTIVSPYETIHGYGFESDQNLTNYRVFKVSGEQRQINN